MGNSEVITLTGNVFNFLIEDNTIERATNIGIDIAGHYAWAFPDTLDPANNQTRAGRIRNNQVSGCKRPTPGNEPAGIYVDGGKDVFVDGNRCFNNGTGISVGCENVGVSAENITVANNLIYNQDKFGMVFGANAGEVLSSTVRNNTFFNNGILLDNSGSLALQKSTLGVIRNNLIYLTSADYFGLSLFGFLVTSMQIDRNLFYSTAGNTPRVFAYNPALGSSQTMETLFFADPLLTNPDSALPDFHLLMGSPAIDAGSIQITLIPGETDIDGTPRTAVGIDIGADEYEVPASRETLSELGLRSFPNPFSQQLTIESEQPGLQAVRLFAPNGAEVWYQQAEEAQRTQLFLGELPSGLYLLQIEHRLGTSFQKIWRE